MHCGAGSFLHTVRKMKKPVALRYRLRITPTCVGNTSAITLMRSVSTVHPYMRREYVRIIHRPLTQDRFTPTRVGKTLGNPAVYAGLRRKPPLWHPTVLYAVSEMNSCSAGSLALVRGLAHALSKCRSGRSYTPTAPLFSRRPPHPRRSMCAMSRLRLTHAPGSLPAQ